MLVDLKDAGEAVFSTPFDVCISGSGPAGISLALTLASKNHRVLLLEAGGLEYSQQSNNVYKGTNIGLSYFPADTCRMRYFGGTSAMWGGVCHEMESIDFTERDYLPHSGWPIAKKDLDPYFDGAKDILDVHMLSIPDLLQLHGDDSDLEKVDFGYSMPTTRFGKKYRETIASSKNLICVLDANLIDIRLNENLKSVASFTVSSYSGKRFEVEARYYALCHGGMENPRTLLNANSQMNTGIGNGKDLVGRFFMEHPHFTVGHAFLNGENPVYARYGQTRPKERFAQKPFYQPNRDFQLKKRVLNFAIRFVPLEHLDLAASDHKHPFRWRLHRYICTSDSLTGLAEDLKGGVMHCPPFDMWFITSAEQSPNPDSRIELGDQVDRFGNRRVKVNWQLTQLDKHTFRVSALEAGRIMASKDLGRLKIPDWLLSSDLSFPDIKHDEVAWHHHMGTTRMADSPERGVVDKNLRVFGTDNLYVGGSSVFPTSGHANPTFTIVQLSLRLADHLHDLIKAA